MDAVVYSVDDGVKNTELVRINNPKQYSDLWTTLDAGSIWLILIYCIVVQEFL